jgi:hypothetical protein
LKGKIENKNQFNKRPKKSKEYIRIKIEIRNIKRNLIEGLN